MKHHILFKKLKGLDKQLRESRLNVYNKDIFSCEQKTTQIIDTRNAVFILKY